MYDPFLGGFRTSDPSLMVCIPEQCHHICRWDDLPWLGHRFSIDCSVWDKEHGSRSRDRRTVIDIFCFRVTNLKYLNIFLWIYKDCGAKNTISHWKRFLARLHTFVVNPIIRYTSALALKSLVSLLTLRSMRSWCAASVRVRLTHAVGTINFLIAVNIFIRWKQNWVSAMRSIRNS